MTGSWTRLTVAEQHRIKQNLIDWQVTNDLYNEIMYRYQPLDVHQNIYAASIDLNYENIGIELQYLDDRD